MISRVTSPAARRSHRRAAWRCALPIAVLAAGLPLNVAGAATAPVLARSLVVTGVREGYTDVVVPRPLSFGKDPKPVVKGGGTAFISVALIRIQSGALPPGVVVTRLAGTNTFHFVWVGHEHGTDGDSDRPTFFGHTLPAGRYRLFLTNPDPVTMTWTLPLPGGRAIVRVKPSPTGTTGAEQIGQGIRGTAVAPSFAATVSGTLPHRTLVYGLSWFTADADAEATAGNCTYPGAESITGLGAAPACLERDANTGPLGPAVDDSLVNQTSGFLAPGQWTAKQYLRVTGAVSDGGISVCLLDLGVGYPSE